MPRFEPEVVQALSRNERALLARGLRLWMVTLIIAFGTGILIGIMF